MSAVAQQLLAKADAQPFPWMGPSTAATALIGSQLLAKQRNEAELASVAMGQLGALAQQKSVNDATLKLADWEYTRTPRKSLSQRLATLAPMLSSLGSGSSSSQSRQVGLEMLRNLDTPTLGAPATRMAGGIGTLQDLLQRTSGYTDAAGGVIATGLQNVQGLGAGLGSVPQARPAPPAAPQQQLVQSPTPQLQVATPEPTANRVDANDWLRIFR
jgi:hypothetical protein